MNNASNVTMQHEDVSLNSSQTIGEILINSGRLSIEDSRKIMVVQKKKKLRFGDAAVKMGILSKKDIQFALSRQFEYPYLDQNANLVVHKNVIASYEPFSTKVESIRALRSQLMLRWLGTERDRKILTIVSPDRKEGRSWLAANLAVVFSQLGERTLLIDSDLRNPSQHINFKLHSSYGLSELISSRARFNDVMHRIPELLNLSIIPSGSLPPNPQEIISRCEYLQLIDITRSCFDVVIIDTPCANECADSQLISRMADSSLIVTKRNISRSKNVKQFLNRLEKVHVDVAGVVLLD